MKLIGVTDINGATPFSNDTITRQIADTDNTTDDVSTGIQNFNTNNDPNANSKNWNHTGEITVAEGYPDSYKVAANNYLMYWDSNAQHYYLMYISQEVDAGTDASGRHINTYQLENVLITSMNDYIPDKTTLTDANAETAFTTLFTGSNWKLDFQATSALLTTTEFDGTTNAMGYLQTMLQAYDVEMDAYVELYSDGNIKNLVVQIVDQLGTDKNHWVVDYGKNMTSVTRTTVYSTVVTKLHIVGANGETIASVNNGKDYLVDDDANRLYNPNWKNGTYLEGTVTFDNVDQYQALKDLGKKQLELFNHPRISYEVVPTADFKPGLGDSIRGTDWKMVPELAIDARVISITTSKSDYTLNLAQFGEFVTLHPVIPGYLSKLTAIEQAMQDASSVKPVALTPDGNNFTDPSQTKRLILQAWEGSTNISSYIDSKGFIWRRHNPDGTIDTNYEQTGYLVQAPYNAVGTLHGTIETNYIQNDPEIKLDTSNIKRVGNFLPTNTKIATNGRQYMCQLSNGGYIGSQAVHGNTLYMLQDSNGYVVSAMTVVKGGHGSSFDVEEADGKIYIWGAAGTDTKPEKHSIARFPYVGGATLQPTDSRIERYITENKYIRVSVDLKHGYVLTSDSAGNEEVLKLSDVKAGNYNVKYSINITNYGFNLKKQTYQSQTLSFPYVIFHSGNANMHDKRMMYAVNVVHGGQEFAVDELNDIDLGITDDNIEPETCHLMYSADNELLLFLTFHCRPALDHTTNHQFTRVITIPIITRPEAPVIDEMEMEDNDNGDD